MPNPNADAPHDSAAEVTACRPERDEGRGMSDDIRERLFRIVEDDALVDALLVKFDVFPKEEERLRREGHMYQYGRDEGLKEGRAKARRDLLIALRPVFNHWGYTIREH